MQLETCWKATSHQQIHEQTKQEMHFLANARKSGKEITDHRASLVPLPMQLWVVLLETKSLFLFFLSFILPEAKLLYPGVTYEHDLVIAEWHLEFQEGGSKIIYLHK